MNWVVDECRDHVNSTAPIDELNLHEVLELAIYDLSQATDETEIGVVLSRVVIKLGMNHFVYASCGVDLVGSARISVVNGYEPVWREKYLEQGYISCDPTLAHCFKDTRPLFWDSLDLSKVEIKGLEIMEEARSCGLRSGISVPIHGAGDFGVLSLTCKHDDKASISNLKKIAPYISYLAPHVHEAARRIVINDGFDNNMAPSLTVREIECLRWAADGKTAWETSIILSISERTVVFHLRNATSKLGASTKSQAVARAHSFGMLQI